MSGDITESFVENETKVNIEETIINLDSVKKEPDEKVLDFVDNSTAKQYSISLKYENMFGEASLNRKFEEDNDNLIGFLNNDVTMENTVIKLEDVKTEEENGSSNSSRCSKCKGNYKRYCLKCSTLSRILNNSVSLITSESESNTIPTDILEIRETSMGKGVFLLTTLPKNVILGPFEGILAIESTVAHSWKLNNNKLLNIKSGNWMKHVCVASASCQNLNIFQMGSTLYFETNREITEGEELLIHYVDGELQQLDNGECLYTPQKWEKLPKVFACTMCCLGFGSDKCLMEHKTKCHQMGHCKSMKDFEVMECQYCKMWLEKWEHEEYHIAYCLEKHHRFRNDYSETVTRRELKIEIGCSTKDNRSTYQRDMCLKRPNLMLQAMDKQAMGITIDDESFSGVNHENHLNKYNLAQDASNEHTRNKLEKKHICSECCYQTNYKSNFEKHLNTRKHRGCKPFQCDICKMDFVQKCNLKNHIKNKHAQDGSTKDYKCSRCSYHTNNKQNLNRHVELRHAENEVTKNYRCSECCYQTNQKHHLNTHVNIHTGIKPFECNICLMKFTAKCNLNAHIKNKHAKVGSEKKYNCSDCSYQTNYRRYLQDHLNKHRGIKPYQCDTCMIQFRTKRHLNSHIKKKHTKNEVTKNYRCSECCYQTNQKHHLNTHVNIHTGIKPFECNICLMKFTAKCNLNAHIKNKHAKVGSEKKYNCSDCSYQTNSKRYLQDHLNKHRGIKPYQCDTCMIQFRTKRYLNSHIKKKHAENESA